MDYPLYLALVYAPSMLTGLASFEILEVRAQDTEYAERLAKAQIPLHWEIVAVVTSAQAVS